MSFVMFATGAAAGARVRTLPVRHIALAALVAAAALLLAGASLGYWLARPALPPADGATPAPAGLPFTLEQLGALSGRLFRLENEAAQLSRRVGMPAGQPAAAEPAAARPAGKPGSGGPMLSPRPAAALQDLDAQLARIEQQIAAVSDASAEHQVAVMRLPTRLPVGDAELSSPFGNRADPLTGRHAFHAGLDFAAEHGTPILAAAGGKVTTAGYRSDYGWLVEIDHGNGLATRYAHASKLLVRLGQVVPPGEKIALVGSTGRSTGPHLHFEVLRHGTQVNPRRYLAGL